MAPADLQLLHLMGSNIRKLRKENRILQNILAQKCQIERAYLSRIESGQVNASVLTMLKIAKALNVDVADFFRS